MLAKACILFVVLTVAGLSSPPASYVEMRMDVLTGAIKEYVESHPLSLPASFKHQSSSNHQGLWLADIYHLTGLRPLWVTPEGPGKKAAIIFLYLSKSNTEGLDPDDYGVRRISDLWRARQPQLLAELDILLTFNLIQYIHDVSCGRLSDVNKEFDPVASIEQTLSAPDLAGYLAGLPPSHRHYTELKTALKIYRAIEKDGEWPRIPAGKTIRPGDLDDRVPAIIHRLARSCDLDFKVSDLTHYDRSLIPFILQFQTMYGLEPDGVIGQKMLAAMNIPLSRLIQQIIVNMERWRLRQHDLGKKYILVNIPNFNLSAFDKEHIALDMPVIVGGFKHQTPVFSDHILYIDMNPYWNIPKSIAVNEELPKLKKNPYYLVNKRIRLFSTGDNAGELDSTSIDWAGVSRARMAQYRLRQDPGPWNSLGKIKFVLSNPYAVYMHDTPQKGLFSRSRRDFSHGCIRVSNPSGLAAFVLKDLPEKWSLEKIDDIIKSGNRRVITLPIPLPVHITYQTVWVDKKGNIYFNRDVYGRDEVLMKALFNK